MLKKTWNRKFGTQEIITKDNSCLEMLEVDMVSSTPGRAFPMRRRAKSTP